MRFLFFGFLLFTLFGGARFQTNDVTVCTLNIRWDNPNDGKDQWKNRRDDIARFIQFHEPDAIGLQEALHSQIQYLDSTLQDYAWVGVGRDDGKDKGEYSPIFYNKERLRLIETQTFWLSKNPKSPSKSWDAALPRICTVARFYHKELEETFSVFNTHFDHVGVTARHESAQLIADKIEERTRFKKAILMGDFNAQPSELPIQAIVNTDLQDVYQSASAKYGLEGTFNGFDYELKPSRRIDYIFTTSDIQSLKYATFSDLIDGHYLSDHFPVLAKLRFTK